MQQEAIESFIVVSDDGNELGNALQMLEWEKIPLIEIKLT